MYDTFIDIVLIIEYLVLLSKHKWIPSTKFFS